MVGISKFPQYRCCYSICFIILSLSSCIQYHPKQIDTPSAQEWKTKQLEEYPIAAAPEKVEGSVAKWWEIFEEPKLNDLEEEGLKQSPTIQLAIAKLKEVEAIYAITRSDQFPYLDFYGAANRQRLPKSFLEQAQGQNASTPTPPNNTIPTPFPPAFPLSAPNNPYVVPYASPPTVRAPSSIPTQPQPSPIATQRRAKQHISFLQVLPEVSYEVDFWGKYSSATQAALMRAKASKEDVQTAYLLLTTQIANGFFDLQSADAQLDVLKRSIISYEEEVKLTEARYVGGLISETDLLQAKVEYNRAKAEYEQQQTIRQLAENVLAVLVGVPASTFQLPTQKFKPKMVTIPVSLPSQFLHQRPDIRQAEDLVEAARLDVGVAKTVFFPSVTLIGNAGYESNKFSSLFKWKNHVLSATAAIFMPILDAGRNMGQLRAAKARYEQQVALFLNQVILAFREVEDALFSFQSANKQEHFRAAEFKNANDLQQLSLLQYKIGVGDYYNVIYAERTALNSELEWVQTKRQQVGSTISLVNSLGGTWQ